jgi:hypothetical protein
MKVFIVFDDTGQYVGYSQERKLAEGLVDQRKDFQKLTVQKIKGEFVDEKMKSDLYNSEGEIFDYYGTFLFEHEQDSVHTSCYEYYNRAYKSVETYMQAISFIKLNDDEKGIMAEFTKEMLHMANCIEDEHYSSEEPYWNCFKVDKLAINILKEMYKGVKK